MRLIHAALARLSAKPEGQQVAWLLLAAFLFLVLSEPLNLVHGYLFAEEGTAYLRYARMAAPLRALMAPHQQYFALLPNALALMVARVLPLSWAAVCSAWVVLLVHLWAVYMVAQCERFAGIARAVAVSAVLLASGAAPVLVGSTQTQFLFALVCVVVLIADETSHRVSRTLAVVLGGLNGVVSCMLTPFFLYRAWRSRRAISLLHSAILCMCCAVQGAVLRHALPFASGGSPLRHSLTDYINVVANHMLVLPFLTRLAYHAVAGLGGVPFPVSVSFALGSVAASVLLGRLLWPGGTTVRILLLAGLFHGICCAMGIGRYQDILGGGERYFFAANGAVGLALVLRWQQLRSSAAQATSTHAVSLLLALLLLSGLVDSVRFWRFNQAGNGAPWADQVRAWSRDPAHILLRPNPAGWAAMYLPPKPLALDVPFYIFDSNTRPEAVARLPQRLFGPDPSGSKEGAGRPTAP